MDLVEIWTYSVRIWSPAQAEIYIDQLEAEINRLAEDPDLGQPTD
jgi:plasmid stabilization system protein ParE